MVLRFLLTLATVMALTAQQPQGLTAAQRSAIDALFARWDRADSPGACLLVAQGAAIRYERAYGQADLERQVPLTADSVFDIGSTSKQFTAACVLLLEQDGKLKLDDRIRTHLGELPACMDDVTIRQLLLHTSGIPDYIALLVEAGHELQDRTTADTAMAALTAVKALQFPPGRQFAYSNSNYFLASQLVELRSGQRMRQFAAERIFTPLQMTRTRVHDDCTRLVPGRAMSYSRRDGAFVWNFSNWEQTGDGAVLTTVGDLWRWAQNFTTGKVGGAPLLAAMAVSGALADGSAIDYGMGLSFGRLGELATVSHGGAWAAYRADLLRVPERDLVVCLANCDELHPSRLCERVARVALGVE